MGTSSPRIPSQIAQSCLISIHVVVVGILRLLIGTAQHQLVVAHSAIAQFNSLGPISVIDVRSAMGDTGLLEGQEILCPSSLWS